jgi:hypothetical protein
MIAERIWLWWTDYRDYHAKGIPQVAYAKPAHPRRSIEYMRVMPEAEIARLHRKLANQQATIRQMKNLIPDIDQPNRRIIVLLKRICELEQQLADMTDAYYRWYAAYMELKYPTGAPPFPGFQSDVGVKP